PDMDHVYSEPNVFVKYKTYVPVEWDFRDLNEKCSYYLENKKERQKIVQNAYQVLSNYYTGAKFLQKIEEIIALTGCQKKGII
ncbi:MAG: glycosyltransferase, partial [Candidatus Omnitrophota bacterium]